MREKQRIDTMKSLALSYMKEVGGAKNIKEIEACSTRIRLVLCERLELKIENLKGLGAKGIIERGNNEIHIVIGVEAEEIVEEIEKLL